MGEDPGEIREEIDRTRDQMAETVDALAAKADVRTRTRERVAAKKDELLTTVRQRMPTSRGEAGAQARRVMPTNRDEAIRQAKAAAEGAKAQAARIRGAARADPRGTALAAASLLAVVGGFLALARRDRNRAPTGSVRAIRARRLASSTARRH